MSLLCDSSDHSSSYKLTGAVFINLNKCMAVLSIILLQYILSGAPIGCQTTGGSYASGCYVPVAYITRFLLVVHDIQFLLLFVILINNSSERQRRWSLVLFKFITGEFCKGHSSRMRNNNNNKNMQGV